MNVHDYLRMPLDHLERRPNGLTRQECAARLDDVFGKFPALPASEAGDLSGGQQKMVDRQSLPAAPVTVPDR
jgi:ABC-type branched-subunit amino acid transport system ATPase component